MPNTRTKGPQNLNVTYLIPFAGNRMVQGHGTDAAIHILKMEKVTGSETWCGLSVTSGRYAYNQRERLKKDEQDRLHSECLTAYLAR